MCDACHPAGAFRLLLGQFGGRGAIPAPALAGAADALDGIHLTGGPP